MAQGGQDSDQEKTEEATQSRREEFRKKGQVTQSRELASALIIFAFAGVVYSFSRFFFTEIQGLFQYALGGSMVEMIRNGEILGALSVTGKSFMILLSPVLAISLVIGLASSILQVGFLHVEEALQPKFEKLNPIEGFKRLFSLRNLGEGVKSMIKIIIVGAVIYMILRKEMYMMPLMVQYTIEQIISYMGLTTVKLLMAIGIAMIAVTAADYFFQRWDNEKKMMMTKQEVKEEHKLREGDPLIKSRIRKIQREMASKRMMEKVPTADVIITNPTHIAVALKYDDSLPAPQLIAKGADLVAEKIKAIARENKIPVVENKPLARTIYKTMQLGQVIPRELFVAVAEVLSYVYKLKKKKVR